MTILFTANICSQRRSAFVGTAARGEEETADGGVRQRRAAASSPHRAVACGWQRKPVRDDGIGGGAAAADVPINVWQ